MSLDTRIFAFKRTHEPTGEAFILSTDTHPQSLLMLGVAHQAWLYEARIPFNLKDAADYLDWALNVTQEIAERQEPDHSGETL